MTSVLEGWGVNNLIQSPPASPSPQDVTQPQFRVGDAAHEGNEESNSTKQLEHSRVWGGDNAVSRPSDAAAGPQSAASPHFCHPQPQSQTRTQNSAFSVPSRSAGLEVPGKVFLQLLFYSCVSSTGAELT